ncbi:MAG: type II secretion system minor pseudopilin GspK [Gammaproteobacteria bacterium]|jgi:general secretion pathway protein K|nr:type II secretion system minor pseudopilin GspK [Gammaproteobacteria bacterium]
MSARLRQRGVALLTALVITAIATVAAVAMASRQQLDVRRTANVIEFDQGYLFALGVESWGMEILAQDRRDNRIDHLLEPWATILPPMDVEGAQVSGRIEDLQGRFNLNNLIDQAGAPVNDEMERLRRLLRALGQDDGIVDSLIDWVDPDGETRFPDGGEDTVYLEKTPPYRAANSPMRHPSELLLVNGVTPELYEALIPHVATLPGRVAVNVNTATVPVLMSLADGITESEAEQIASDRGNEGYDSMEEFLAHPVMNQRLLNIPNVSVSSSYFMIHGNVTFGRNDVRLHSLVRRGQDARMALVMRTQGTF